MLRQLEIEKEKIELIKYIVKVKQQEASDKLKEKETKEQNQKILEIIAKKEDESLQKMDVEDLKKLLK